MCGEGARLCRPAQGCKLLKGLLHLVKLGTTEGFDMMWLTFSKDSSGCCVGKRLQHKGGSRETSYEAGTQVKDDSVKFSSR